MIPAPAPKSGRRPRVPAPVAGAVVVYLALARLAFAPLHEAGHAQAGLGFANGLAQILQLPGGVVVGALLGASTRSPGAWVAALAVNFVFYFLATGVFLLTRRRPDPVPVNGDAATGPKPAPVPGSNDRSLSRRGLLRHGATVVVGGGAAVGSYALFVEPRQCSITRRAIPVRDLPPALDGLTVAQVTDVHLGPWISLGYVNKVVAAVNALGPDLVILTGDYVHESAAYIRPVAGALAGLRARIGVLGVLGNHDWWEGGPLCQREFAAAGIPLIDNSRQFVSPGRSLTTEPAGLCVAGIGDLWEDRQLYDAALGGLPVDMPRLLLSHNPDAAEDPGLRRHRVDLMISGHMHGGQVRLPGLGTPVVPSRYGQKYASGLVNGPSCRVWISRGIGMAVLPLRLGVPPEVAVLELTRA